MNQNNNRTRENYEQEPDPFGLALIISVSIFAADVEVNLNGNTADKTFEVKNTTPETLLKVGGTGNVGVKPGSYLNFGTEGQAGYGFRDNSGTLEYKNASGVWTPWTVAPTSPYGFGDNTYSFGQMHYDHYDYSVTNQPRMSIFSNANYGNCFPATVTAGNPYSNTYGGSIIVTDANGVQINNQITKPVFFKVVTGGAGLYRISASIALEGSTVQKAVEIEVFKSTSPTTWTTGTHDIESLSSIIQLTNGDSGSANINGYVQLAEGDYIGLFNRCRENFSGNAKIICINFNVERVK